MWNNTIHYQETNPTHPWELRDLAGRKLGEYQTFRKAEMAARGVYSEAETDRFGCSSCQDSGCEHCPKVRAA